ncbi:MAG: sterol desaturase family protein [Terriglobia bacterium]
MLKIPLTILYANGFEYFYHRYPMHAGSSFIRHRHTTHHQAITAEADQTDNALAFTPPMIAVFLLHVAGLLAFDRVKKSSLALPVSVTLAAYLVALDWIHEWQHAGGPARNWLTRWLRWHHDEHHRHWPTRFNIFLPIWDFLLGTLGRGQRSAGRQKK